MSTLTINKYSDNRIKHILKNKVDELEGNEKETAKSFIVYPRLDFQNTETIASILNIEPEELFKKKEISASTLNYRNKNNHLFDKQVGELLTLFGEIDKQFKYYGGNNGK
ncbi:MULTISPECIES: hypothetical protein [Staphylococcus]|uniref:hypothetical protein n=1 Tax=Staphylococcus TaxID=1279 RepID=UPI0009A2FF73|nr:MULTISPECIES: hypothetical protein [Staphylococcus]AUW63030.1 hypothetical protein AL495_06105 [Staphylococcus hominis]OPF66684.1 hypothetical protein ATN85_09295 [Staphylococcus hominis]